MGKATSDEILRTANLLQALAGQVSHLVERRAREHSERGSSALAAMNLIRASPGLSIVRLSRALKLSHPATVRLVAKLQEDGLVLSEAAKDRRALSLALSELGSARIKESVSVRTEEIALLVALLSARDQEHLARIAGILLGRLSDSLEEAHHVCRLCDFDACPSIRCPVELAEERMA